MVSIPFFSIVPRYSEGHIPSRSTMSRRSGSSFPTSLGVISESPSNSCIEYYIKISIPYRSIGILDGALSWLILPCHVFFLPFSFCLPLLLLDFYHLLEFDSPLGLQSYFLFLVVPVGECFILSPISSTSIIWPNKTFFVLRLFCF
jgi:hypothetical protein